MIDLTTTGLVISFCLVIYLFFTKDEKKTSTRKIVEIIGLIALTFILNWAVWKINFIDENVYIWTTVLLALLGKGFIAYVILKVIK